MDGGEGGKGRETGADGRDAAGEEGGCERRGLDEDEHAEQVRPREEREEELVVVEPDAAADPRAWRWGEAVEAQGSDVQGMGVRKRWGPNSGGPS